MVGAVQSREQSCTHRAEDIVLGEREVAYCLEHLGRIEGSLDAWAGEWRTLWAD